MRSTIYESPIEWLTFKGPSGQVYQVNLSFFLSNYHCIFGAGCPGLMNRYSQAEDMGCCERGVTFTSDEDFEHVEAMVEQLTADDADNLNHIRSNGWYQSLHGNPYKTKKLHDNCIFSNRGTGPTGKIGCAFHHLALRTGQDITDTKPEICWTVPLSVGREIRYEDLTPVEVMIISAHTADAWGGWEDGDYEDEPRGHMGYWCTDTPDAYTGDVPAYKSFEQELRKLIGDEDYERMVELIKDRKPLPMPAQLLNEGRPLIPLLVEKAERDGLSKRITKP
jgi:hypothetical protein